jgi:hypothetical protein
MLLMQNIEFITNNDILYFEISPNLKKAKQFKDIVINI